MSSIFVATIETALSTKLIQDLQEQGFTIINPPPPYSIFSAKKTGISCTLYNSGKLTVQGKNSKEFIEFYLEPEILHDFSYSHPMANLDLTPRIGIDESGKGDVFGPLCTAGVYANGEQIQAMAALGICDSKKLSDIKVTAFAPKIKELCPHAIIKISPGRYNEMYEQFHNLNRLLAWSHAAAIEELVKRTHCSKVIVDQFASEHVVESALKHKNLAIELTQRHRAEEDVVVAAASILARHTFIEELDRLSKACGVELPKGASPLTIQAGREFVKKHGSHLLPRVAKMHFKTLDAIMGTDNTND